MCKRFFSICRSPDFSTTGAYFRGAAASIRTGLRVVGQQRTLAFASEGAVAGEALIPRPVYYGLWGLSGLAIVGDIATKTIGKAAFQFKVSQQDVNYQGFS